MTLHVCLQGGAHFMCTVCKGVQSPSQLEAELEQARTKGLWTNIKCASQAKKKLCAGRVGTGPSASLRTGRWFPRFPFIHKRWLTRLVRRRAGSGLFWHVACLAGPLKLKRGCTIEIVIVAFGTQAKRASVRIQIR